jgi:hypothetical protein
MHTHLNCCTAAAATSPVSRAAAAAAAAGASSQNSRVGVTPASASASACASLARRMGVGWRADTTASSATGRSSSDDNESAWGDGRPRVCAGEEARLLEPGSPKGNSPSERPSSCCLSPSSWSCSARMCMGSLLASGDTLSGLASSELKPNERRAFFRSEAASDER